MIPRVLFFVMITGSGMVAPGWAQRPDHQFPKVDRYLRTLREDPAADNRKQAVQYLHYSAARDARTVPALLAALADADARMREEAASALDMQDDTRAVDPLIGLLADPDASVRQAAISTLGRLDDPRVTPALVGSLQGGDAGARAAAMRALVHSGDARLTQLLLPLLADAQPAVRIAATNVLSALGTATAIPGLIARLDDATPAVAVTAASALAEFDDPRVVEALVRAADRPGHPAADEALDALGHQHDPRVLPALRRALADRARRPAAIRALGQTGDPRAVDLLLPLLKDPASRVAVLEQLCRMVDPRTIDAVLPLAIQSGAAQESAIRALGATHDPRVVPVLARFLRDHRRETDDLRYAALVALSWVPDRRAAQDALIIQTRDADALISQTALELLVQQPDAGLRDLLLGFARKPQPDLRDLALYGLAQLPDARAVQAVLNGLRDPGSRERIYDMQNLNVYWQLAHNPKATPRDLIAMLQLAGHEALAPEAALVLAQRKDRAGMNEMLTWARQHPSDTTTAALTAYYGSTKVKDVLLAQLLKAEKLYLVEHLAEQLGRLGDERAVAYLRQETHPGRPWPKYATLDALSKLKIADAERLQRLLTAHPEAVRRPDILAAAAQLRDTASRDALLAALRLPTTLEDDSPRPLALAALGMMGDARVIPAVAAALDDPSPDVRRQAKIALARSGDSRGLLALPGVMTRHWHWYPDPFAAAAGLLDSPAIRTAGLLALRRLASADSWGISNPKAAIPLIRAFAARRDVAAVPGLRRLLEGSALEPDVQLALINALGVLKDRASIPQLIPYLSAGGRDRYLRTAAARALTAITGQNLGDDRRRWEVWYVTQK